VATAAARWLEQPVPRDPTSGVGSDLVLPGRRDRPGRRDPARCARYGLRGVDRRARLGRRSAATSRSSVGKSAVVAAHRIRSGRAARAQRLRRRAPRRRGQRGERREPPRDAPSLL